MSKLTLDEAIKVLRQHNEKGASVLRITRGQALEKDLLSQVLDSCEQLISEKAKYKRLLKAAVKDMSEKNFCAKVCNRDKFACQVSDTCDFKWRYADEALKLIGEDSDTNGGETTYKPIKVLEDIKTICSKRQHCKDTKKGNCQFYDKNSGYCIFDDMPEDWNIEENKEILKEILKEMEFEKNASKI